MEYFFNIFIIYLFDLVHSKWLPTVNFEPDSNQFHIYKLDSKLNIIYQTPNGRLPENFEWLTVASVTLSSTNSSFIVFGGSQQIKKDSNSPFNKQLSVVILCQLKLLNNFLIFHDSLCKIQRSQNNGYLGAAVKALSLTSSEAVLVYCDPLWITIAETQPVPSGKCYLTLINDKYPWKEDSIEFCKSRICMAGFSIDLLKINSSVSGFEMVVGTPHKTPYGGTIVVRDPFGKRTTHKPIRSDVGKYFNFGYAVSMIDKFTYASSPLSDRYLPNITEIWQGTQITNPDNKPFNSFGAALTILSIRKNTCHAIVVGAPFHSTRSIQNVGKVYVFCHIEEREFPSSSIYGENKDEFLGYSLANIGDINGDGNDDVAIGSPFLRDNDARGFVSIYTVNGNCKVQQKPYQILKTTQHEKIGIFGISITGGSDMDFNSWPDVIVTSTKSNSIELFASRPRYEAHCRWKLEYKTTNYYKGKTLEKNEIIPIHLFLQLMETRKDKAIDIESIFKKFKLVTQINPNLNVEVNRFDLNENPILIRKIKNGEHLIRFSIKSLLHIADMDLTNPITIAYRFIEDCGNNMCNNLHFPLINWDECNFTIPVNKYVCLGVDICDADIALNLNDEFGNEVFFGVDKSYHRSLEMKIVNYGPTVSKGVKFKISTFQNLRINKIVSKDSKYANIKDLIAANQTEASVKLDELDIEVNSLDIIINIDLYFIDFKDPDKMKYENNSIVIELYSGINDSNLTNNVARIDYTFVYEPNITYSGSSKQETVIDNRIRSQPLIRDQRIELDIVGPRFQQDYVIYNIGKGPITNMTMRISLPLFTEDKLNILYLFDKIRSKNGSTFSWVSIIPQVTVGSQKYQCSFPANFINPFKIIGIEGHESHLLDLDLTRADDSLHVIKKRSADQSNKTMSVNSEGDIKTLQGKMHRITSEIIQCNRPGIHLSSLICADVVCEIPIIPLNKQASVQVNAWLLASTFFKKQISDILVYSTLEVNFGELPQGVKLRFPGSKSYSQYQQFVFKNVKPKLVHITPIWPIIVGIVIGTLILAILIVALYKCGFFKRNKRRRHFRSTRNKRNEPVIVHPADIQTASSMTSHSNLINDK